MYNYIMLVLGFFVIWFFARVISAYHPNQILNRYIVIKNEKLVPWLISNHNPEDYDELKDNKEENRNKLTLCSLVFYILLGLLIVFSAVMLFVVPEIPCKPFEFEAEFVYFHADTLNEALPFCLTFNVLSAEITVFILNMYNVNKDLQGKKRVMKVICIIIIALLGFAALWLIWETITMFL